MYLSYLARFICESWESSKWGQSFLIMGCIWLSRNLDTFSVGARQLEMIGPPVTFDSCLWILGSRYNFPSLQVFLNSKPKCLNSFSVISLNSQTTYYFYPLNWRSNAYGSSQCLWLFFCFQYKVAQIPNHKTLCQLSLWQYCDY